MSPTETAAVRPENTDVVVVGAGPTGLLLAGDLAEAGVRVVVLERRAQESNVTRAFAVHARTMEELQIRGVAAELEATIPAALDTFFARALAVNPSRRYKSVHELAEAFASAIPDGVQPPAEGLLASGPVAGRLSAPPPPSLGSAGRAVPPPPPLPSGRVGGWW